MCLPSELQSAQVAATGILAVLCSPTITTCSLTLCCLQLYPLQRPYSLATLRHSTALPLVTVLHPTPPSSLRLYPRQCCISVQGQGTCDTSQTHIVSPISLRATFSTFPLTLHHGRRSYGRHRRRLLVQGQSTCESSQGWSCIRRQEEIRGQEGMHRYLEPLTLTNPHSGMPLPCGLGILLSTTAPFAGTTLWTSASNVRQTPAQPRVKSAQ